jgi:GT2 family glycosyltransferase
VLTPAVSVVILTMGLRRSELRAAVASALAQRDLSVEVVVVANGCAAESLGLDDEPRVRVVPSAVNLGIPGGRNVGGRAASAPVLAFLDDDASYLAPDVLREQLVLFERDPHLAVVAQRIVDEHGNTARRHIPRLGARGSERSGPVAAFLGGAALIRRPAFLVVGGYPDAFGYAMEETDLSWRLVDAGWTLWYDGRPAVRHPATEPTRHAGAVRTTMRNRVWMAHRCLPAPLAVTYVAGWLVVSAARAPATSATLLKAVFGAWPSRPGPRRPIGWRTVWRLTRLGRPPVL